MPGDHIGSEQQFVHISFVYPKPSDPFSGLYIAHLAIVESSGHKHRRIVFLCDIVVRRIGKHIVVFAFDRRIAPFLVFESRQGDRRIGHCGDDVHKRHFRHDAGIKVRSHIGDDPHEETTGAAASCKYRLRIGIALRDKRLGHGNEISESVALVEQSTFGIPAIALFPTAAHMGDGLDEAAVQELEADGAKVDCMLEPYAP